MEVGGTPKKPEKTKMKKNVDPPNSGVPFLSIFVENGSQDGGPNPSKIAKKSIQTLMFFLTGFWMHFGRDLGAKMGEKIDAKTMSKTCWDRS